LLQQGVDFKVIQDRLSHSDIGTTMNIYSHVNNKDMQKKATEKLNNILGGKMKYQVIKPSVLNGTSKSVSRVLYFILTISYSIIDYNYDIKTVDIYDLYS